MKFETICRICLEEGEMKSIFTTNCLSHIQMSCADAIVKMFTISVEEDDGLPKHICKKCLTKLKSAYKFKMLCEDSFVKLMNHLDGIDDSVKIETDQHTKVECVKNESSPDTFDANETYAHSEDNENENVTNDSDFNKKPAKKKRKKKTDRQIDQTDDAVSNSITTYNCDLCEATFSNKRALIKHKQSHISKPYFCEICQKNFNSEYAHKISHDSGRQFQCEICAKIFLRAATLRTHLLVHNNVLPFRCTHPGCEKEFPLNSRLKLHLKVHTNERNFICQYCSHAARDKQQLTVHIRYFHTKEKNFLCGTCGKGFVSPQARYYHAKRHENIRNHHCPHCDKSFVFAFGLQEHLVTHTGEKRFMCSVCDTRFSRKAHKINHEIRIHGINKSAVKKIHDPMPLPTK
ncbi:uncharacterized protein LOC143914430 [Arctopsyche grandis]|uniref:uncharacterized protein LOC143914430 n=1 Tax=Arctopsyche grandis TaxID=121162 RepID=UPI00406D7612